MDEVSSLLRYCAVSTSKCLLAFRGTQLLQIRGQAFQVRKRWMSTNDMPMLSKKGGKCIAPNHMQTRC